MIPLLVTGFKVALTWVISTVLVEAHGKDSSVTLSSTIRNRPSTLIRARVLVIVCSVHVVCRENIATCMSLYCAAVCAQARLLRSRCRAAGTYTPSCARSCMYTRTVYV